MAYDSGDEALAALFHDLVRCETRLYNATGEVLRRRHGIVTSQLEFLRHLSAHPDARVGDLATAFAAGVGAISKGIDRLEARGLVLRVANPADRRSSLIRLTGSGAALLAEAERTFHDELARLVPPALDAAQIEAVASAMSVLRHALEEQRVGLPTG